MQTVLLIQVSLLLFPFLCQWPSVVLFSLVLHVFVTMSSFGEEGHSKRKIKFQNKWLLFFKRRKKVQNMKKSVCKTTLNFILWKTLLTLQMIGIELYMAARVIYTCTKNCNLWTVRHKPNLVCVAYIINVDVESCLCHPLAVALLTKLIAATIVTVSVVTNKPDNAHN